MTIIIQTQYYVSFWISIQIKPGCVQLQYTNFSKEMLFDLNHLQLQESDFDERSLSLCESTEASERMCGDFFNTVKKGPAKVILTTIEPPPEFQVGFYMLFLNYSFISITIYFIFVSSTILKICFRTILFK